MGYICMYLALLPLRHYILCVCPINSPPGPPLLLSGRKVVVVTGGDDDVTSRWIRR